jgi:hypothetical protein
MMRRTVLFVVALAVFLLLLLPLACGGGSAEETSAPEPTSTTAGAETAVVAETPAATHVPTDETPEPEPTSPPEDEAESTPSGQEAAEEAAEAVAERTPLPTPVPGPVEELVTDFTVATGLAGKSFLGLTVDDWINLGISVLIFVAGYQLGHRAMRWLLRRIVRRTPTEFDDEFLEAAERELKWFVGLIFLWFATFRLGFLSDGLRTLLNDLYFTAGLAISGSTGIATVWRRTTKTDSIRSSRRSSAWPTPWCFSLPRLCSFSTLASTSRSSRALWASVAWPYLSRPKIHYPTLSPGSLSCLTVPSASVTA